MSTADHNVIHLIPAYKTQLQREGVLKTTVKQWDSSCTEADSLEEATDVATDYFKFCEENIHSKTVEIFSNNKPWMTKELKTTTQNNKMKRK